MDWSVVISKCIRALQSHALVHVPADGKGCASYVSVSHDLAHPFSCCAIGPTQHMSISQPSLNAWKTSCLFSLTSRIQNITQFLFLVKTTGFARFQKKCISKFRVPEKYSVSWFFLKVNKGLSNLIIIKGYFVCTHRATHRDSSCLYVCVCASKISDTRRLYVRNSTLKTVISRWFAS